MQNFLESRLVGEMSGAFGSEHPEISHFSRGINLGRPFQVPDDVEHVVINDGELTLSKRNLFHAN